MSAAILMSSISSVDLDVPGANTCRRLPRPQNKSGKIDLYADPRAAEKEARKAETSGDWDQAKLEQVVKMKAMGEKKRETEIVCKHFLTAVHKGLYGWFWQCPSGKNCQYKHNLPPGFILKKPKDSDEEEEDDGPTLEEVIEEQRAKLTAEGTPVTLESFMAWKEKKKKEQAEKKEEKKDEKMKKLSKVERSMGMGLSGRELFDFKPDAFVDDDSAADDIEQYKGVGAEEMDEDLYVVAEEEETSAFDDNDESLFDEFEDEPEPAVETAAEREAREERMALETVEAAKDMEEDGELETALAMFEEAWAVLGAKRPKLKNRINKLKQEVAAAGGRAGTPAGAEPEPEPEPADRPSTAPAAVGVDVDESLFEDSDDSD